MNTAPELTIGVEEELFLVDKETRELITDFPDSLLAHFAEHYPGQIIQEFLLPQVEIISKPHDNMQDLRLELQNLRHAVISACADYGMAPIAASTHPFSHWTRYKPNMSARYQRLYEQLQIVARRFMVAGMHLHVGIDDDDQRIELVRALSWYLPHMVALSSSSPFWMGQDSGLNGYRLCVIDGLPRSGLPLPFNDYATYQAYVDSLVDAGVIGDATELWWDARLSCRFPTIELRVTDVCTRLEDVLAIVALYRCLVRRLYRTGQQPLDPEPARQAFIKENRWRAQRYPLAECALTDGNPLTLSPVRQTLSKVLAKLDEDAKALDCVSELEHIKTIMDSGTSADRQRKLYQQRVGQGADQEQALRDVVDHLITETALQ